MGSIYMLYLQIFSYFLVWYFWVDCIAHKFFVFFLSRCYLAVPNFAASPLEWVVEPNGRMEGLPEGKGSNHLSTVGATHIRDWSITFQPTLEGSLVFVKLH